MPMTTRPRIRSTRQPAVPVAASSIAALIIAAVVGLSGCTGPQPEPGPPGGGNDGLLGPSSIAPSTPAPATPTTGAESTAASTPPATTLPSTIPWPTGTVPDITAPPANRTPGWSPGLPENTPGTPEYVTVQWLLGAYQQSYTDPGPTAWVGKVQPWSTSKLAATLQATADAAQVDPNGATAREWERMAQTRAHYVAVAARASIASDADCKPTGCIVVASYTPRTFSATQRDGWNGTPQYLQFQLVQVAGAWRVDAQLPASRG